MMAEINETKKAKVKKMTLISVEITTAKALKKLAKPALGCRIQGEKKKTYNDVIIALINSLDKPEEPKTCQPSIAQPIIPN